jgi:hypothetical protein
MSVVEQLRSDEQLHSDREVGQAAACASLRRQIAKLERELAGIVADGFPNIPTRIPARGVTASPRGANAPARAARRGLHGAARHGAARHGATPRLLTLGELEQLRDALALRVREAQLLAAARSEHQRRARTLLEAMRADPRRHKFMRLRVVDLGEGGCGVWEVRPRLGLIGMLSGWWELKLSSGCP